MQQSTTELELLSTSAISPLDDRRISLLFDIPGNGSQCEQKRSYRWNGNANRCHVNGLTKPKNKRRKKPKPSEKAPQWERRTVRVSLHFFYVVAVGVLFCSLFYLIHLNRGIYARLIDSERFVRQIVTVSSANEPAETSTIQLNASETKQPENLTDVSTSATIELATQTAKACPHSNRTNNTYSRPGVRLYVGHVGNHSDAERFCRELLPPGHTVQIVQFSDGSKLENTREDVETLLEQWSSPIWVRATVYNGRWFWVTFYEEFIPVGSEIDVDDSTDNATCAVLQKRNSELRLEVSECRKQALIVCECNADS